MWSIIHVHVCWSSVMEITEIISCILTNGTISAQSETPHFERSLLCYLLRWLRKRFFFNFIFEKFIVDLLG